MFAAARLVNGIHSVKQPINFYLHFSLRLGKLIDLKVSCEFFGWFTSILACICANDVQVKFMHMSLYVLLASEAKSFLLIIIVHLKRVGILGSIQKNLSRWQSCLPQKYWWTGAAMIRLGNGPSDLDLLRPSLKFSTENRSHLHWEIFIICNTT